MYYDKLLQQRCCDSTIKEKALSITRVWVFHLFRTTIALNSAFPMFLYHTSVAVLESKARVGSKFYTCFSDTFGSVRKASSGEKSTRLNRKTAQKYKGKYKKLLHLSIFMLRFCAMIQEKKRLCEKTFPPKKKKNNNNQFRLG